MSPHPAPLVTCRAATSEETPRNAASLVKTADELGWRHRLTYAKGTSIDRAGEPTKVVESIVLRLRREPLAAAGVWLDGKFSFAWVWSKTVAPQRVGARMLTQFVKAGS